MTNPGHWQSCVFLALLTALLAGPAATRVSAAAASRAAPVARDALDFNLGWRFHLGDVSGAEQPVFDDAAWRRIDLPHDWSIELPRDKEGPDGPSVGYSHGGTGWYRKQFVIPAAQGDRPVEVIFDGVQQDAEVWINGHSLGLQPHGYIGFVQELTPHLRPAGQPNVLAVRAVNPEWNSRWYSGAGLYRQVRLRVRGPVDVATWGARFNTVWITREKAQVQVRTELRNDTRATQEVTLRLRLQDPQGGVAEFPLGQIMLAAGAMEEVGQLVTVGQPQLWSPDTPALYTAELQVLQAGRIVGGLTQSFGIRQVSVSASAGFRLNGEPLELKGGCLHHNNGLIGAAAFPTAEWRRVAVMKRNGFNAIRTSHNPPSTAFLEACDRLGMLVIDEFTDAWEMPKKPNSYARYFDGHWASDLKAMLRRDYDHPSVVMWSIGNEVQERALPSGIEIARRLVAAVREIDPDRPVTNAICHFWDNPQWANEWEPTAPAFALLDAGGYNYKWDEYEKDHARYPARVMVGTESFPLQAYENWRAVETLPYVIGDFVWTGMDHLGESGIGHTRYLAPGTKDPSFLMPWPTWINWSGDIDVTGEKKPQSYYRDVVWGRSPVEIAVHGPVPAGSAEVVSQWGWPDELPAWNWPGSEGRVLTVRVFARAARVALDVNGARFGEQPVDLARGPVATFSVPYAPGDVKATAFAADGRELGTRWLRTTGPAAAVSLRPELDGVTANRANLVYVPIEIRDSAGRLVDNAGVPLTVATVGPAELLALGSADPTDVAALNDGVTNTFRGRALLVLRSTGQSGVVRVTVTSAGLTPGGAEFALP